MKQLTREYRAVSLRSSQSYLVGRTFSGRYRARYIPPEYPVTCDSRFNQLPINTGLTFITADRNQKKYSMTSL